MKGVSEKDNRKRKCDGVNEKNNEGKREKE